MSNWQKVAGSRDGGQSPQPPEAIHGLTKENLSRTLPISLSGDPKMVALAESISELLAQRREEIRRLAIYPSVDKLDESLLDILARDFKVDWWDYDYSLDEKRRTLSTSWQVHKTLGTKAAVETAIRAIYPRSNVREWFEYEGGKPYHFRLEIDITNDKKNSEKQKRVLWRLNYYKNLRSHIDGIFYYIYFDPAILENRQRFSFVAMKLFMEMDEILNLSSRLWEFKILAHKQNQLSCCAGWFLHFCAATRDQYISRLNRVTARMHGPNNLGIIEYLLDGRRRLDGSWPLGHGFLPGLSFRRMVVNWRYKNPHALGLRSASVARYRVRSPTGWAARSRFTIKGVNHSRQSMTQHSSKAATYVEEGGSLRAYVTADTMWRLDGTYRLDGTKKLNASIERSEL